EAEDPSTGSGSSDRVNDRYKRHKGPVASICSDPTGQHIDHESVVSSIIGSQYDKYNGVRIKPIKPVFSGTASKRKLYLCYHAYRYPFVYIFSLLFTFYSRLVLG
ncbi:hypothetical protein Tco_1276520, partial [Tanacetum coccineum]